MIQCLSFERKHPLPTSINEVFGDYLRSYCRIILKMILILWTVSVYASTEDLDFLQNNGQKDVWILSKSDSRHNVKTWYKQETGKHTRTFKV